MNGSREKSNVDTCQMLIVNGFAQIYGNQVVLLQHRELKDFMLCIWWDQLGILYYELLKLNEIITVVQSCLIPLQTVHNYFSAWQGSSTSCDVNHTFSIRNFYPIHYMHRLLLVHIDCTWAGWVALHMIIRDQKLDRFVDNLKRWSVPPMRYPYAVSCHGAKAMLCIWWRQLGGVYCKPTESDQLILRRVKVWGPIISDVFYF